MGKVRSTKQTTTRAGVFTKLYMDKQAQKLLSGPSGDIQSVRGGVRIIARTGGDLQQVQRK